MLTVNPDEGTIALFIPQPPMFSEFYVSEYIRSLFGALFMFMLLYPITLLPGLFVIVLPAEIYLSGKLYDELEKYRAKKADKLAHLEYWEQSTERNERARMEALSARRVSDYSR